MINPGDTGKKVKKSDGAWQLQLAPLAYAVTRKQETERAFSGKYWNCKLPGIYRCICCDNNLFSSMTKFDSGTGWPSFWAPFAEDSIEHHEDKSWLMERTEVSCSRCNAHLGHVFADGPEPTNLRYCINSVALMLVEEDKKTD